MRIEIFFSRFYWTAMGLLLGLWTFVALVAVPLTLLGVTHPSGGRTASIVIAVIFGGVGAVSGTSAWRLGRSEPHVTVGDSDLTIHHPGIFRHPLRLDRKRVHAVYFQRFPNPRGGPPSLPISSRFAPDLSLRNDSRANMLIVLAEPLPLRGHARFGLTLWNMGRGESYYGPTRGTVAHGFFAYAVARGDSDRLRTWRTTQAVPPERLWNWLGGWTDEATVDECSAERSTRTALDLASRGPGLWKILQLKKLSTERSGAAHPCAAWTPARALLRTGGR